MGYFIFFGSDKPGAEPSRLRVRAEHQARLRANPEPGCKCVAGGALTGKAQYVHRGAMWARIFNDPLLDRVKAYDVTDLFVEYVPNDSPVRLSLAVTNLFDQAGVNSRFTDPYGTGQTSQQFIPPRQVIGTVAYRW